MAILPNNIQFDQTLMEVDKAIEARQKLDAPRHYLGASQIGKECSRELFYSYRGCKDRFISANNLKAIQDGYKQENIMAERLRFLPYIQLCTDYPEGSGKQIHFEMLLGHFNGNLDGMIYGILEAPKTWHVWENKAVNEEKFQKLLTLRQTKGEKNTLFEWDAVYYAQGQVYMLSQQVERHYLTVQTPGGRKYASIRTNFDRIWAEGLVQKANMIIFNNSIPSMISENDNHPVCKWCDYKEICHQNCLPLVNCKTCRYCKPVKDGERECLLKEKIIPKTEYLLDTCPDHIYLPSLIPLLTNIDSQDFGEVYKSPDGTVIANCSASSFPPADDSIHSIFTSKELKEKIQNTMNINKNVIQVQKTFNGYIANK